MRENPAQCSHSQMLRTATTIVCVREFFFGLHKIVCVNVRIIHCNTHWSLIVILYIFEVFAFASARMVVNVSVAHCNIDNFFDQQIYQLPSHTRNTLK